MDTFTLSNILASVTPKQGFRISGDSVDESSYNESVFYNDLSQKPSWAQVQAGEPSEQWVVIRGQRNRKLRASDWSVLPDVPMTSEKKSEWETYRQALRDITNQPDPFNITWPTPPA